MALLKSTGSKKVNLDFNKEFINSILKSKLTFLLPVDFNKAINVYRSFFLRLIVYKMIKFNLNEYSN